MTLTNVKVISPTRYRKGKNSNTIHTQLGSTRILSLEECNAMFNRLVRLHTHTSKIVSQILKGIYTSRQRITPHSVFKSLFKDTGEAILNIMLYLWFMSHDTNYNLKFCFPTHLHYYMDLYNSKI